MMNRRLFETGDTGRLTAAFPAIPCVRVQCTHAHRTILSTLSAYLSQWRSHTSGVGLRGVRTACQENTQFFSGM